MSVETFQTGFLFKKLTVLKAYFKMRCSGTGKLKYLHLLVSVF